MRSLRPTDGDVERMAHAECDPAQAEKFEPIALGFAGNLAAIVVVGFVGVLCALVLLPVRIVTDWTKR
jgi:hypothetical protein